MSKCVLVSWALTIVLVICVFSNEASGFKYNYGVLIAELPTQEESLCITYYPDLHELPSDPADAKRHHFKDLNFLEESVDVCENDDIPEDVAKKIAFSSGNATFMNCSIAERAINIERHGGIGLLTDGLVTTNFSASEYTLNISVASLHVRSGRQKLLELATKHPDATFFVYGPETDDKRFDASLLLIMFMAVVTVAVGSLWSGYTKHYLRLRKEDQQQGPNGRICTHADSDDVQQQNTHAGEDISLQISPWFVLVFVVCMCTMLVMLYFFFDKLVFVIIGMFCLASVIAMYSCLEPLVMWSYHAFPSCPTFRLPRCNMYICSLNLELRQFALLIASIGVTVVWVVFRKTEWSWILQDILGIMFSINMLKVLRLPSLKICTILLSSLFIYDIFFVFLTPLFTKDGESVMVKVATGGNTGEQLPMVLRVPHFNSEPLKACWSPYSMLGFGDILVPGLLLSYCHSFDLQVGNKWKVYWITTNVAYTLGLVATFISLYLMNSAQPALLYLVPFTVIPTLLLSWGRGDLAAMWAGDFEDENIDEEEISPKIHGEDLPEAEAAAAIVTQEDAVNSNSPTSGNSNDSQHLIK